MVCAGRFASCEGNNSPVADPGINWRKMMLVSLLPLFLILAVQGIATGLEIKAGNNPILNELLAANDWVIFDEDGDPSDWIELHNPGEKEINLLGYSLSDDPGGKSRWKFPAVTIEPGGYLLVWASGKDRAEVSSPRLVVRGGGWDIWEGSDGFHFHYVKIDGENFDIIARVCHPERTHPWAKAGVMVRASLDPESPHVSMFATPDNGFAFQRRLAAGGSSYHTGGAVKPGFPDAWVKISRRGSILTGYASNDGQTWQRIGYVKLEHLPDQVYVGLAVTSHAEGVVTEAHFGEVLLRGTDDLSGIEKWLEAGTGMDIGTRDRGGSEIAREIHLHTDFCLDAGGEHIALYDPQGKLVDEVRFGKQKRNASYGRIRGTDKWAFFIEPTPGRPNTTNAATGFSGQPVLSLKSGAYTGTQKLVISAAPGAEVFYTDGSIPTRRDYRYTGPLTIAHTSVVRARAFEPQMHPSDTVTGVYLIDEEYTLPVLSIVTDPRNLWDRRKGIYVNPNRRGRRWERPAVVTFIEPGGLVGFQDQVGLRISGGAGRNVEKKSFRLYWRDTYEKKDLEYPLFPKKDLEWIKRVVVRAGGNDHARGYDGHLTWTLMRCSLMGELWRQSGGLASTYRTVVVLLNGDLWGIYNLRERIDKYYLQANLGVDPDNVDLLKTEHPGRIEVNEGDRSAWDETMRFFRKANLRDDQIYERAAGLIDIENFTDWNIFQIYAGNWDWPQNNVYTFRVREDGGKWRWIMWDLDDAFDLRSPTDHNTLVWATRDGARPDLAPPWYREGGGDTLHTTLILRRLLENQKYRFYFINRLADLLNTTLSPGHVIKEIDERAAVMGPDIRFETQRWGTTVAQWWSNVERMKRYAQLRPDIVRQHVVEFFPEATGIVRLRIDAPPSGGGTVRLNTIEVNQYPWEGVYFRGVPVKIKAIADKGCRFTGWAISGRGVVSGDILRLTEDVVIRPRFEKIRN